MVWPSTPSYSSLSKSHFDAGTDKPSDARAQLAAVADRVNDVQAVVQQIVAHGEPVLAGQGIRRIASGQPLPIENQGPLWHDDYNSWMTWQVFNANGAAYTGYASVLVGSLLLDTQPTPRPGYVRSGASNLSRTTYAALRAWAIHHGRKVDSGVWAAGQLVIADNPDGTTFCMFDIRGEHPRAWDDGRGVDYGRAFGSWQAATRVIRDWWADGDAGRDALNPPLELASADADVNERVWDGSLQKFGGSSGGFYNGHIDGIRVRGRNVALLATFKF